MLEKNRIFEEQPHDALQKMLQINAELDDLMGEAVKELESSPFTFCSSTLARARETAEIIGDALSRRPLLVDDLREHNNGIAANLTREEAEKIRHPVTEPVMDWIPYPEAESWRMLHNYVVSFMERIKTKSDISLLVAHSMVIVSVIHW